MKCTKVLCTFLNQTEFVYCAPRLKKHDAARGTHIADLRAVMCRNNPYSGMLPVVPNPSES